MSPETLTDRQNGSPVEPAPEVLFDPPLTPVLRLSGGGSLQGLIQNLRVDRSRQLQRAVSEALAINETSFFRDRKAFDMLRQHVLPRLIEQREARRTLRLWSAATSTGQETYSLAMLLLEHFPELAGWDVQIFGTDASRRVIRSAERGRYTAQEAANGLSANLRTKYFQADAGDWVISGNVRAMCTFHCSDLCAPDAQLPVFDLVLMRNVLLYFAPEDRAAVFQDVYRQMTPDGYLLLGDSEQAEDSTDLFHCDCASDCYFYRPAATS